MQIRPGGGPILEVPGYPDAPQRILFPYDVSFTNLNSFPSAGNTLPPQLLTGSIQLSGGPPQTGALFELVAGEDPYFTNVGAQNNEPWLSTPIRNYGDVLRCKNFAVLGVNCQQHNLRLHHAATRRRTFLTSSLRFYSPACGQQHSRSVLLKKVCLVMATKFARNMSPYL